MSSDYNTGLIKQFTNSKFVLVVGNVVDGLTFYGPFEDSEDAVEMAEIFDDDWIISVLH